MKKLILAIIKQARHGRGRRGGSASNPTGEGETAGLSNHVLLSQVCT